MAELATTRLSSKGQVVIPEDVRDRLGLKTGDQFIVVGEGDVVILKTISPPSMKEFDGLVSKARSQARRAGLKPSDVASAIGRCEPIDEGCAGYECTCIRHFLFRSSGQDSAGMESRQVPVGA